MTVKELIDTRNELAEKYNADRKACFDKWFSPEAQSAYNQDFISGSVYAELEQINLEEAQANMAFNKKLNGIISDGHTELKSFYYPAFTRPQDYQMQIANALTLFDRLGSDISEADAKAILEPFSQDFEQMRILRRLFEVRNVHFTNVFARVDACSRALEKNAEMQELASRLFIRQKHNNDGRNFNGRYFALSYYDGYDEIAEQARILRLEKEIGDLKENM